MLRALSVVGSMTLLSRILGFIRDMVIAQVFGASASADAFLVAFKIPNFMRRLFAEGAFSQAFVPVLNEYKTQRPAEVQTLIDHVAGSLSAILSLITLLGILAAPLLILLFAPGFSQSPDKYALSVDMLRITFPYLLFISLTAFAGGILNTYGRFSVPAFTPVLLNLSMIAAALWFAPWFEQPIMALAWGVLLAGVLQLAFQLPFLYRLRQLPRPRWHWGKKQAAPHEGVGRILRLMLPVMFAVSVTQISLLIDTLMASFLETGSIAWLYYSDRLLEFPIGIFGVALATVVLPQLSRLVAEQAQTEYEKTLDWSLRWVFLVTLPSAIGLILLSEPLLTTLFQHGEFSAHDVMMSSRSLMAFSVGLPGFVLIKILASGFFARQDTRTPTKVAVIAMLTNITLNLVLIWPLAHAGLALATALAALVNAGLLYYYLCRQGVFKPRPGWWRFFLRLAAANVGLGLLLWWGVQETTWWLAATTMTRAWALTAWVGAGILVYFGTLWLGGLRIQTMLRP